MAGPSGTKLIDLHMTDRGQTTEMFSPNVKLDAGSELREAINAATRHPSKRWANVTSSIGVLGAHVAIAGLAFALTDYCQWGPSVAELAIRWFPSAAQVASAGLATAVIAAVVAIAVKQQKSSTMTKQSTVFSIAAAMSVELLLIEISMGHQTYLCYLPRWFKRRGNLNHFAVPDNYDVFIKKNMP
jgi:hypothetical protein